MTGKEMFDSCMMNINEREVSSRSLTALSEACLKPYRGLCVYVNKISSNEGWLSMSQIKSCSASICAVEDGLSSQSQ